MDFGKAVLLAITLSTCVTSQDDPAKREFVVRDGLRYRPDGAKPADLFLKGDSAANNEKYIIVFYQHDKTEEVEALDGRIQDLRSKLSAGAFPGVSPIDCKDNTGCKNTIEIGNLRMMFVVVINSNSLNKLRMLSDVKYIEQDQMISIADPTPKVPQIGIGVEVGAAPVGIPDVEKFFIGGDGLRYSADGAKATLFMDDVNSSLEGRYRIQFKQYQTVADTQALTQRIDKLVTMFGAGKFSGVRVPRCADGTITCRTTFIGNSIMLTVYITNKESLESLLGLYDIAFIQREGDASDAPDQQLPEYITGPHGLRFRPPGPQPARLIEVPPTERENQTPEILEQYLIVFKKHGSDEMNQEVSDMIDDLVSMFGRLGSPFESVSMLECPKGETTTPCILDNINGFRALFVKITNPRLALPVLRGLYDVLYIKQNRLDNGFKVENTTAAMMAVNGGWTAWGPWSGCQKECMGTQVSLRFCTNPKPMYGGEFCKGEPVMRRPCSSRGCFDAYPNSILNHFDQVIGTGLSAEECLRTCLQEPATTCASVNVEGGGERRCSLTKVTKSTVPDTWPEIYYPNYPGWTYYERKTK